MSEEKTQAKKPKEKTFVMIGKIGGSVYIPVYDENGEQKERVDRHGNPIINRDGTPKLVFRRIVFDRYIDNPKVGTVCRRDTSDPEEIEALERFVKKTTSSVNTLDAWKKSKNLAAWENEQKFLAEQQKRLDLEKELEALKAKGASGKQLEPKKSEIKELKADLDKAKKG